MRGTLLICLLVLCGCIARTVRIPQEDLRSVSLDGSICEYLEDKEGLSDVGVKQYQRSSTGSKLFISFSHRVGDERRDRTAIVTPNGIRTIPGYSYVYYDDQENPVFRIERFHEQYDDQGEIDQKYDEDAKIVFRNGLTLPRKGVSVRGILGGDYVLLRFTNSAVWIVSKAEDPRQALFELPRYFQPQHSYVTTNGMIFLGLQNYPSDSDYYGENCLLYEQRAPGVFELAREIRLAFAGGFYDMDPNSGQILVGGDTSPFPAFYRYNIRTKHRTRLGFVPSDHVLFLKTEVVHTLHEAIREARKAK